MRGPDLRSARCVHEQRARVSSHFVFKTPSLLPVLAQFVKTWMGERIPVPLLQRGRYDTGTLSKGSEVT